MSHPNSEIQTVELELQIKELIELAREHGGLVYEDIEDRFSTSAAHPVSVEGVCGRLQASGIQIMKEAEALGITRLEEAEGRRQSRLEELDDPMWVHVEVTRRTPPLSRLREMAACRRLADAQTRLRTTLSDLGFPTSRQYRIRERESARSFAELQACVKRVTEAQDYLLHAELPLVLSLASEFAGPEFGLFESLQRGNLALLEAVRRFNHRGTARFSAYAGAAIRRAITQREPLPAAANPALLPESSEAASPLEAGTEFNPVGTGASRSLPVLFRQAFEKLNPHERRVVGLRFGCGAAVPLTVQGTAQALGIPRTQVRAIERHALTLLRPPAQVRQNVGFATVLHCDCQPALAMKPAASLGWTVSFQDDDECSVS